MTVSPQTVTYPDTKSLTYSVQITTGAEEERFSLAARGLPAYIGFDEQPEGQLLAPGIPHFEGPGTLGPVATPAFIACTRSLRAKHGTLPYAPDYDVTIPANVTTTLVIPVTVAEDAPWPGEQYRLGLTATGTRPSRTLDGDIPLSVPAVVAAGRVGVRMSIATNIASVTGCGGTPPPNAGVPITIAGRADTSIAGQQVAIVAARWESARETLATVPVAADGSFAYGPWRPRSLGRYEVGAQYASTRPDLADDFAAARLFELTVAVPQVAPQVAPVARVGKTAPVRRGAARVRLSCPAGAQACEGVIRLTLRGKLAGLRKFKVAAGTRATVSVSLRAAARRALKKSRRVRMRAEIRAGGTRSRTTIVVRLAR